MAKNVNRWSAMHTEDIEFSFDTDMKMIKSEPGPHIFWYLNKSKTILYNELAR
jgi:hypothetical protein